VVNCEAASLTTDVEKPPDPLTTPSSESIQIKKVGEQHVFLYLSGGAMESDGHLNSRVSRRPNCGRQLCEFICMKCINYWLDHADRFI